MDDRALDEELLRIAHQRIGDPIVRKEFGQELADLGIWELAKLVSENKHLYGMTDNTRVRTMIMPIHSKFVQDKLLEIVDLWINLRYPAPIKQLDFPIPPEKLRGRVKKSTLQADAILAEIKRLGYLPTELPKITSGKRWVKAEVRSALIHRKDLFPSEGTFKKAWENLRQYNLIAEADQ
jgi:tRNA nucleotidyltransferase/poly(A) polymerase